MCDCFAKINEDLSVRNAQIAPTLVRRGDTIKFMGVRVETHKLDKSKRSKPVNLTASYCPFCGEKYEKV